MAYAALAVEVLILVQADQTVVPLDELVLRVTGDLAEEIVMGVDTAERVERCAGRVIRRDVGLAVDMDADEKVRMLVLVVHGPVPLATPCLRRTRRSLSGEIRFLGPTRRTKM